MISMFYMFYLFLLLNKFKISLIYFYVTSFTFFFNYLFERGREAGRMPLQQCSIPYLKKPHKLQVFTSLFPCTITMTIHLSGQAITLGLF